MLGTRKAKRRFWNRMDLNIYLEFETLNPLRVQVQPRLNKGELAVLHAYTYLLNDGMFMRVLVIFLLVSSVMLACAPLSSFGGSMIRAKMFFISPIVFGQGHVQR